MCVCVCVCVCVYIYLWFHSVIYVEPSDAVGHKYGPESQEIKDMVKELDKRVDIIQDELEKRNLTDKVNVIIVSDHGMANRWEKQMINMSHYIEEEDLQRSIFGGPLAYLWPKPNKLMKVRQGVLSRKYNEWE